MAIAMTVIELIAGEIFIVKMHVKLWDYTGNKFNYKGIICPLYSLIWAALGAVYYFFIHPYILDALNWLANNLAFSFFIGFFSLNEVQIGVNLFVHEDQSFLIL